MKISSAVEICNLALTRIDQNTISSLTPDTLQGRKCALVYEQCKTSLLSQYPWSFAIQNAKLNKLTTTGVSEYKYKYSLPEGFLRVVTLMDENYTVLPPLQGIKKMYALEGGFLFSDAPELILKFVSDVDSVAQFSPLFIDSLKLSIAIELTKMFNSSATYLQQLMAEFSTIISKATTVDCQQSVLRPITQYPLLSKYRSAI